MREKIEAEPLALARSNRNMSTHKHTREVTRSLVRIGADLTLEREAEEHL